MSASAVPDYYAILGVSRTATPAEIEAAFRALARRYHPDVCPGDPNAEAVFKQVNEAHAVLADPEKRRHYDALQASRGQRVGSRARFFDVKAAQSFGAGAAATVVAGDEAEGVSDLWQLLVGWFGTHERPWRPTAAPLEGTSSAIHVDLWLKPSEAYCGGNCEFWLSLPSACQRCRGQGATVFGPCPACGGSGIVRGPRRTMRVYIPPGTRDGDRLRVKGALPDPTAPGYRSDLILRIRIRPVW